MGEAKKLSVRIRDEQPLCIFCGGQHPSETVEHYPPKIIFDGKRRPKGMEYGACKACNAGSAQADQIAGMLARIFPDATTKEAIAEYKRIMDAAERSAPGLLLEMRANQAASRARHPEIASRTNGGFLNVSGPIITGAVATVGAKLGLALHFEVTGNIVPTTGAVLVNWYSNIQAFDGKLPDEFIRQLGPGITLRQGKFSVDGQFRYASMIADDGTMSGHFAVFREAFAILMLVTTDATDMPTKGTKTPGFLRSDLSR